MSRALKVAALQAAPAPIGSSLDGFREAVLGQARAGAGLIIFPELHLFGADVWPDAERVARPQAAAVPLDGEFVRSLGSIAREAGAWLIPGSICERGPAGELFNTALAFNPDGDLVAWYRKIFPWRPFEPYDPGDRFVVFEIPDVGCVGLSICYDAWFPEVTRQLAWMGAEVVVNIVKTTTPDREHELVLARANSIVNQTFTVSVNCAGPVGMGRSIIVDPDGAVLAVTNDADPAELAVTLDLDDVSRIRRDGTAGVNRMWDQFRPDDKPLALPLYAGRIDPATWHPHSGSTTETLTR